MLPMKILYTKRCGNRGSFCCAAVSGMAGHCARNDCAFLQSRYWHLPSMFPRISRREFR